MTGGFQLLPPNDVDSGWTFGELEGYANQLYARAKLAEERLERVGMLATDLLTALQPWEFHDAEVRSAAVRLTVALAALPLPEVTT